MSLTVSREEIAEATVASSQGQGDTYGQILKATTLIGGSQVLSVFFGMVRTKILAVLLGPGGVGLMGLYGTITGLVGSVAGLGVGSSGVRQIAEAVGTGDQGRIAVTIKTVRRVTLVTGLLGMLLLITLSGSVSRLTFGNTRHTSDLALLSVVLFFGALSGGQAALIQGLRRIRDLAKLTAWGAAFSTIFSIPLIYWLGEDGIVPFLIAVALMGILSSWWYARKITVQAVRVPWPRLRQEAVALLRLGLVFMSSSLMTAAAMYFLRVIVVRQLGLEAAGFYQAASGLSNFYIGIILSAMGADFYPRLTAVGHDNAECNRLVNEQAEVGLLISVPGILATMVLAPLVIEIFYSAKFFPAVDVLRWQILGLFLRITCWPMAYIMLAKGAGKLYFWTELAFNTAHVGLIWAGISFFGLAGTGIAFFVLYVLYWITLAIVVQDLSAFCWTARNIRLFLILFPAVAAAFLLSYVVSGPALLIFGGGMTAAVGVFSAQRLFHILGPVRVQATWGRLKAKFGRAGA